MLLVSDANSLIGLVKGGVLHLLRDLFTIVYIPEMVFEEVVVIGAGLPGAVEVAEANTQGWLTLRPSRVIHQPIIRGLRDATDRQVLALAYTMPADFILTDDRRVRSAARQLAVLSLATVDVLLEAKKAGLIPACKPVMDRMIANGFGIRHDLYASICLAAGE